MNDLNPEQRSAVTAGDGPALVLAGAGSGKTRVITERIVWLVRERGVDPRTILALTFTNRAANEMRSRVARRMGVERLMSWLGTFHSFGLYILRREIQQLDRPRAFTVFDDQDQLSLVKRLIKSLPPKFEKVSPREALSWTSLIKQDLEEPGLSEEAEDAKEATFRELWSRYHQELERSRAVDFDDLLVLTARLFREHEEVRDRYKNRYRHLLVDEYQDTNRAQYEIVRALAGPEGNLLVVGDEDQSIYSWRGATVQNILGFEKDFPSAKVYRLEQNYRSTASILAASNAVVENNTGRLGKKLWTDRSGGEAVRFHLAPDAEAEALYVIETLASRTTPAEEVVILFRTNGQVRLFEETLLKMNLAYRVVGGTRFYARKEIKDLLCYMRLLVNPHDDESLRRIVNVPPRGIGSTTLGTLLEAAAARREPLITLLREAEDDQSIGARARKSLQKLTAFMDDLTVEARTASVAEILERILNETDYIAYVEKSDEKDFRTRIEIVEEFQASCTAFDARGEGGLETFLQDLSLMTDVDEGEPSLPAVTLMTCHSAKGLEFDDVFLVGLEEGLLPHASTLDSPEEVEEERRLCYVAMTRARNSLVLTAAEQRTIYGERRSRETSRFLREIPEGQLTISGVGADGARAVKKPAGPVDSSAFKMGTLVRHARFGRGRVMYTSGSGKKLKARIRFDKGFSRQFMVSAAPLEIIEGKK